MNDPNDIKKLLEDYEMSPEALSTLSVKTNLLVSI